MGIFSRTQRVPEPQISIHLNQARDTFHPGSPVCGTFSILSPVPRQLLSARICLIGRLTTHCTRRVTRSSGPASVANTRTVYIRYHDEVQLFNVDQELLSNTSIEPSGSVDSNFSFEFPAQTGAVTGASPYTSETALTGVYASEAHALPPSFSHFKSPHDYAIVEYRLLVVAYFGERAEPFIYNEAQPLVYAPLKSPQQTGILEFVKPPQTYASSRLLGEEKSIGHSLRDKFSSKTPSVNVVLKTSIPASVFTAAGFMLHTCIEIDGMSHSSVNVPTAVIGIKSLKLVPTTAWRALKVERSGHMFGDAPENEVVEEETVRLSAVPSTVTVEQRQAEKVTTLAFPASFEARIPGNICAAFKTYNINRSYLLKITLEAEICGKVFEHKIESCIGVL